MLRTLPLIGFIPTTNPERSRRFYVETLGFKFEDDGPFAVVVGSDSNMIRLVKLDHHEPSTFTILGWEAPDIEQTVRDLVAAGVTIERYGFLTHDDLGIWTSPDGTAKVAWFKDPDGNTLSVSHHS
jgi:catechol 2,3-dioxygenase-like lactoylglutathione lyase family enzyme